MNVVVSILQIVLALHTALGAVWKSSYSERTLPSLGAIPHGLWQSMVGIDLLCAVALVVPLFERRTAIATPIAAVIVAAEMLYFSGVHIASGSRNIGPVIYWLAVAAVCAFVAYGRLVLKPVRHGEFA